MALVSVKIPSVLDATCRNHRVGVKKGTVKDAKSLGKNEGLFGATKRGAGNGSIFAVRMMRMITMMMITMITMMMMMMMMLVLVVVVA